MKIGFLGGGNMATALIGGMLERGFAAADIQVVDALASSCASLEQRFGVRARQAIDEQFLNVDVLMLAVKPQQMKEALAGIAGRLEGQLVISIAAGLRVSDLARWLGGSEGDQAGQAYRRVVRCMPNTPALIGAGMTGLYADPSVDAAGRDAAARILAAVGEVLWVEEEAQLDAVTAISGSGPAYVFHFIEALEAAALTLALPAASARQLALHTVLGAARLAAGSSETPTRLREQVTSKGGTTAAALERLQAGGWHDALIAAARAAAARSHELGVQLGEDRGDPRGEG